MLFDKVVIRINKKDETVLEVFDGKHRKVKMNIDTGLESVKSHSLKPRDVTRTVRKLIDHIGDE